jgi:hypothetical protein
LGLLFCFGGLGYADGYTPRVGETLVYKVIVKSAIHGADQTIKVVSKDIYNGRDVYNIHSEMGTIGFVKGLFKYAQVEDLVLDAEGLYPWVIKLTLQDSKHNQQEEIRFDYAHQKAYRLITKKSGEQKSEEIDLPGFVQDGLSLQFFLRKDQIVNGVNKVYFYNSNGSISTNNFTVKQSNQAVHLDSGTFSKCLQIIDDVGKFTILVTDNPERLPIIIKSIANFGTIEMKLSMIK